VPLRATLAISIHLVFHNFVHDKLRHILKKVGPLIFQFASLAQRLGESVSRRMIGKIDVRPILILYSMVRLKINPSLL
jgi:hypothetical protein